MSAMLDRVARAICDAVGEPGIDCTCEPGTCLAPSARRVARAAVTAMREADEVMLEACFNPETGWRRPAGGKVWRAMIEAALTETAGKETPT